MVDTHCHLNFSDYETDIDEVVKRAIKNGVTKIICASSNVGDSRKAVEIAKQYAGCFATVGVHPHHAGDYDTASYHSEVIEKLRELAKNPRVVAIGETGLDYHEYQGYPEVTEEVKKKQEELFVSQLELAKELHLPVIIHCRDAWEDILATMLYNNVTEQNNYNLRGVFHCYMGGKKGIKKVEELGFYFGIDGNITYDEGLQNVVREIPLEKLLLETDSPFLSPESYRGKRNEPANIPLIAEMVAQVKGISLKEVEKTASQNANSLFQIKG